jgi:hypothetical protein
MMSLSNELDRWGLYGSTLSPKGKAQVLNYSWRALMMENAIKRAIELPTADRIGPDLRQQLYDALESIEDGRDET